MSLPKHKAQKPSNYSATVKKVKKVKERKSQSHSESPLEVTCPDDQDDTPATDITSIDDASDDVISEPQRNAVINFDMIVRRNLSQRIQESSHEEIISAVHSITHLRLDRENVNIIDNLEMLGSKVTNVYLQQNRIRKIENLEFLQNLEFLILSDNHIEKIENLQKLQNLKLLDISCNRIQFCDTDELPKSLIFLTLSGNPCTQQENYRHDVISALPKLIQLDREPLSKEFRRAAGHLVADDGDEDEDLGSSDESGDDDTVVNETGGGEHYRGGLDDYLVTASREQSGAFQDLTLDIHQRCKLRMMETDTEHVKRKQILAQIRDDLKKK